ncbi:metallophosphoesterase family protein [Brevibacillus dissolubilis]|uniref:metallophosphoesterase family protein n=1 Tax=Brevibacillus dissolubilis TaxID=1844116 RepID=UPI0011174B31|nr:metallophosphoesterase [Brevibacillus dissolubilis]
MKKSKIALASILSTAFLLSTIPAIPSATAAPDESHATKPFHSNIKIAVFSDPHYYAPELGTSGQAYEDYLAQDRKLLSESEPILQEMVDKLKNSDVDVVLVSGDLTKDGEKVSHLGFANYLQELEDAGKKVYVIEGNHDLNNPHAVRFDGDKTYPVDQITPEQFKEIYADFGYDEAIAKDPNSMSYVVEPVEGLYIVVMDSALYADNHEQHAPETAGEYSRDRMNWIKYQLRKAKAKGKLVIGMTHHGIVEHYAAQDEFFPEYVVRNWDKVSTDLADLGMKAVFTGHYHSHDIAKKATKKNNFIYDIETGSLVTYPIPYRLVEINKNQEMTITSVTIQNIDFDTDGKEFPTYAHEFLVNGLAGLVPRILSYELIKRGVPADQALPAAERYTKTEIVPGLTVGQLMINAMVAHYQGDEKMDAQTAQIIQGMLNSPDEMVKMLGGAAYSLLTDSEGSDNHLKIDLKTGEAITD